MVKKNEKQFEIRYGDVTMQVERLNLPGQTVFRVVFSSERPPLVIAKAENAEKQKFWTSIPQGRQREAAGMGKLIDEYLNKPR